MARCPNCGRETLRTEDWACQWCGYPLLGRGYKKIPKTYKQLQDEMQRGLSEAEPELEVEVESEMEAEVVPEPEPAPRPRREPVPKPELKAGPVPEAKPEPVAEPEPEPEPEEELEEEPEERLEPEPAPGPPPKPELKMEPVEKPEPGPDPKLVLAKLEANSGQIQITVDEVNSVYQADKLVANAKLKDKIITVTGLVEKIFVREHLDIRYILLTGTKKGTVWSVRCTFGRENASPLERLTEGQAITVRGEYDGYGNNIIMKDCALVI